MTIYCVEFPFSVDFPLALLSMMNTTHIFSSYSELRLSMCLCCFRTTGASFSLKIIAVMQVTRLQKWHCQSFGGLLVPQVGPDWNISHHFEQTTSSVTMRVTYLVFFEMKRMLYLIHSCSFRTNYNNFAFLSKTYFQHQRHFYQLYVLLQTN